MQSVMCQYAVRIVISWCLFVLGSINNQLFRCVFCVNPPHEILVLFHYI